MKFIKAIILSTLIALAYPASARLLHGGGISIFQLANSQLNPQTSEGMFINALKTGAAWVCTSGGAHAQPSDVDVNGYPLPASSCPLGASVSWKVPTIGTASQFERPGNYVVLAAGRGTVNILNNNSSGTNSPGASSCTGVRSGGGNVSCNNAGCTSATGQIAGQTLTITVASSCTFVLYQPITNGSTTTNKFGVPTMIIGMSGSSNCPSCTGAGGTGTYLVNWSQTVASGSMVPGMYNEINSGTETSTGGGSWSLNINATDATNPLTAMAVVHVNDLLLYAQGQLTGVLFKQRVQQGNFAILRDLPFGNANAANTTSWAYRKPAGYYSYGPQEMRASLFACSYGLYNGTTPCQTNYALNVSSNDYSVNLGASLPVDKQTVCVNYSTTTTGTTNTFSIDNGVTKYPMVAYHGSTLGTGNIIAGHTDGLVFDAAIQKWFTAVITGVSDGCLQNYGSPEAFIQVNQEIGTAPWIVEPYLAADPITDFMTQYALLIKNYSWNHTPIFEIPDEPWNCAGQGVGPYVSLKSAVYVAADATWSANASGHTNCGSGDIQNWTGKAGSLLGQALRKVSNTYVALVGGQSAGNGGSLWQAIVRSNSYVGQNPANIPTQSGCAGVGAIQTSCPSPFTQTAAYTAMAGATSAAAGVTISNYWGLVDQRDSPGTYAEVALAYCYYYQTAGCASQASVMTTYYASQSITNGGTIPSVATLYSSWHSLANTCGGGAGCSPMSVYNYEGTYSVGTQGSDKTSPVTASTNAASAVLSVSPNGCVAGQTVTLSSLTGGTWSTAAGSYTVQATGTDSTHCAINLNSTGLGTLSSATLTYTGSASYITYFRTLSWIASDLDTWTTFLYNTIASTTATSACSPAACSYLPSQFLLQGSEAGNTPWLVWSPDLYGYYAVATCSSCSASANSMTLGGTVTGIFLSGQTLVGGGISGATITGACSQTGSLPAGANVGDVCPISSASTVTTKAINGTIAPATNAAGNSTTSPVTQWGAICRWNSNGLQCNN